MMKTEATHTQPYPPSGGGSVTKSEPPNGDAISSTLSVFGSEGSPVSDILVLKDEDSLGECTHNSQQCKNANWKLMLLEMTHLIIGNEDPYAQLDIPGDRRALARADLEKVCGEMTKLKWMSLPVPDWPNYLPGEICSVMYSS